MRQLDVGNTGDVSLLDDVARVDVVVATGLCLTPHHEEHARLAVGFHHGAHRCDVPGLLALDAPDELVEARLREEHQLK